MIGYDKLGSGTLGVMILNDWMCDTSTWDRARAYLDEDRFTWTFADLRGYGRSMDRHGAFTVAEATADVVRLADALGWRRFAIVGHCRKPPPLLVTIVERFLAGDTANVGA